MRDLATIQSIERFFTELGKGIKEPSQVYITGGASAILKGWRQTSLDIDFMFNPELDEFYRRIPRLKEQLKLNLEIASPSHFIPELPGWQNRSEFIVSKGQVSFYHYDFYSQALSKIERGHDKDMKDVKGMLRLNLVDLDRLRDLFNQIEEKFYRYPNVDLVTLKEKLTALGQGAYSGDSVP